MSVKLRVVLPVVVLGFALTGCSSHEPGKATAGDSPPTTSGSAPAPSSGSSGIAAVEPCSLLKSEDMAKLGLTPAERVDANSCQWRTPDRTLVRLNTYPALGMKDIVPGPQSELSDLEVGTHKAKLIKKSLTSTACAMSIELTSSSRVDINATGMKLEATCPAVQIVAEAIEPNLP
ncbi:DUF3558 family protein [Lentzea sp. NPDC060358]|uniref:DUF3558 family protein n=1 Tax=Lentzea sp. NPDC060358 TaxID=3347103 RepID=UPI003651B46C